MGIDSALKRRTSALTMTARDQSLTDVLLGQGRGAVLALLYGHPDQSFYYKAGRHWFAVVMEQGSRSKANDF